ELLVISQISYQAMYDSLGEARLDGKTLVNLSSGTPAELREAARWVAERGGTLITGGIMVPPPGIGQPGAYTFYSGPKEALDRYAATLEALSAVTYVGEDPGLAMMYYQAQLLMFWSALTSFMHAAARLETAGARPTGARTTAGTCRRSAWARWWGRCGRRGRTRRCGRRCAGCSPGPTPRATATRASPPWSSRSGREPAQLRERVPPVTSGWRGRRAGPAG